MPRELQNKAVLFADISESSTLYKKLGDAGARTVVHACMDALAGVLPKYEGRLVKTLGDAVLCVFSTADLAVRAAGEMQSVIAANPPANHPVGLHLGVAYGPIIVEHNDIFGDTVNVAAYLTKVAMREQILTTDATEMALAPELKACVRPVFHTVLKGSARESIVYQVLWKTDNAEMTAVNLQAAKVIPGDIGSLVVALEGQRVRIDQWRPAIRIGRSRECEIVVTDRYASREHLTIRLMRTRFYLVDHSINGTFVTLSDGDEIHVLRGELPLERSGQLSLGRSSGQSAREIIKFDYDRRSLYRI